MFRVTYKVSWAIPVGTLVSGDASRGRGESGGERWGGTAAVRMVPSICRCQGLFIEHRLQG